MTQDNCFRNPIISGFNPDPSIVRVGTDYFLVTSTFEYFPGIPIYHSTDLVSWKLIGHVLTRSSQLNMRTVEPSGGVWAPTLRYHEGRKRFYVSVGITMRFRPKEWDIVIPCGFQVWTDNIFAEDSWSDPVHFDVPGIDQDLFFDDDGKVYMSAVNMITEPGVKKHGLGLATHTCEIDLDTGRSLTAPMWNRTSSVGIGIAEGPHIFKKDGYYYLSTADGGTDEGHQQWICRSTTGPFGPWEEGPIGTINPIVFNADHRDIRNTGHLDMIEDEQGKWWGVFLGVRPQGEGEARDILSSLGRETFMAPMEWIDGWPIINGGKKIELLMQAEGKTLIEEPQSWRDDFNTEGNDNTTSSTTIDKFSTQLSLGWYHLQTPLKQQYSLTHRKGYLSLFGNAYGLTSGESPCMVLQKQKQHSMTWRTQLEFTPSRVGHEAGTAIWWSQFAYASIGVRRSESGGEGFEIHCRAFDVEKNAFVDTTAPLTPITTNDTTNTTTNTANSPPNPGPITLTIIATPTKYTLYYSRSQSQDPETQIKLGQITTRSLTHRTSGQESPNTGAHFALYAHGAFSMPCVDVARFGFVEWVSS